MTVNEMILQFKLASDNLDSSVIPDFSEEVILYYLNEAQERFIKTRYSQNNLYKLGFEETNKRTQDLNNIKDSYYVDSAVTKESNVFKLELTTLYNDVNLDTPSTAKFMFYLRGRVYTLKNGCTSKLVRIKEHQTGDLDDIEQDPFNRSIYTEPVGYFEAGNLYIKTDDTFSIGTGLITCIRHPKLINSILALGEISDCELAEHTHKEIVALAVQLAIGDVKPEKLEVKNLQAINVE